MFSGSGLGEEGVEGVVADADRFVRRHLSIWRRQRQTFILPDGSNFLRQKSIPYHTKSQWVKSTLTYFLQARLEHTQVEPFVGLNSIG